MRVRVLLFGVLRERMGLAERTLELPDAATVGELLRILQSEPSKTGMDRMWQALAVAVNREYSRAEQVLAEGDEVALLPPVSGGCGQVRQ